MGPGHTAIKKHPFNTRNDACGRKSLSKGILCNNNQLFSVILPEQRNNYGLWIIVVNYDIFFLAKKGCATH